jgi:formate hydrogenlyase subunit 3/multisubunit Na+/H+ antiporter MnhD subunit
MMTHWLWIALLWPLFAGIILMVRPAPSCYVSAFLRTAPLPALIAVVATPLNTPLDLPWLFLGARFELLETTRIFLLFTSLLWLIAGWYAVRYLAHDPHRARFATFWMFSFAGNIGLIITGDIPGFYTFFALMGFSAYALVIHTRTESATRAGRIYLAMAILGEVMILSALLMIATIGDSVLIREAVPKIAGSGLEHCIIGLILFGFGVKTGLLPLHGWLPLAHPAAPTPASAVLSGAMIKAGLLGWITFLPGGFGAYPGWGTLMIVLGLLGAFGAVAIGLTQSHPKTNLAYSSISQMGVMTLCVGIGMADPADWPAAVWIAAIYSLNHAFAKGALFLGVGVVQAEQREPRLHRHIIFAGMGLAALAIAGAPMTGGALAKRALKYFAPSQHPVWGPTIDILLPLTAVATTLLLTRLLVLLHRQMQAPDRKPDDHPDLMPAWVAMLLAVGGMAWLTVYYLHIPISTDPFTGTDLTKSLIPVLSGLLLAGLALKWWPFGVRPLPPGDVVVPLTALCRLCSRIWTRYVAQPVEQLDINSTFWRRRIVPAVPENDPVAAADQRLRRFEISGGIFVLLMALIMWTLYR